MIKINLKKEYWEGLNGKGFLATKQEAQKIYEGQAKEKVREENQV